MIKLKLTDDNLKEFERTMSEECEKAITHFERELVAIRTGRAHPALIENIKVHCYGGSSVMPLKQLAAIAIPEQRLITIEPWDKSITQDIEKALMESDLGITPDNRGTIIYLRLPEMSSQRRDELIKILHQKLEETRVSIRNIRKEFHNLIKDSVKDKSISEDHSRRLQDSLQKITDLFIKRSEDMTGKKEREVKII